MSGAPQLPAERPVSPPAQRRRELAETLRIRPLVSYVCVKIVLMDDALASSSNPTVAAVPTDFFWALHHKAIHGGFGDNRRRNLLSGCKIRSGGKIGRKRAIDPSASIVSVSSIDDNGG